MHPNHLCRFRISAMPFPPQQVLCHIISSLLILPCSKTRATTECKKAPRRSQTELALRAGEKTLAITFGIRKNDTRKSLNFVEHSNESFTSSVNDFLKNFSTTTV